MSRVDPLELMQFHDGELSPEQAERLEQRLAEDAESRAALEGLTQVGDFVRRWAEDRAAAGDAIASAVLDQIETAAPAPEPREHPALAQRRRSMGVAGPWLLTGALAAAASGALWFGWSHRLAPAPAVSVAALAPPGLASSPEASRSVAAVAEPVDSGPDVAIETVDFGSRNGTIFMVSSGEDAVTPVVWVPDDSGDDAASVSPL